MKTRLMMAFILASGCAANGSTESYSIQSMSEAEVESGVFYFSSALETPLTRAEAEWLGVDAREVRVRVYHNLGYAVAWDAPNGEPRIGHVASILGAWALERTPIENELDDTTQRPDPSRDQEELPTVELEVGQDLLAGSDDRDLSGATLPDIETRAEWLRNALVDFVVQVEAHPGCIEELFGGYELL